jgi:phosphatidylglycerol:prolipoprotein diacylglycerol transferase
MCRQADTFRVNAEGVSDVMGRRPDVRYTPSTVPIAVVTFQFDPSVQLFGDLVVRWGTIALVAVIVAALVLAGVLARRGGLRADDVAFVAIGIVPGAVIGGRLGYVIAHPGALGSAPELLFDPSVGGLELGLAVVGGFVTGSYVASLLGSRVGRWLHLAMAPTLFVLGAGKLTMVLTGTGQGQPDAGAFATHYLGPGPWGSLLPALPSVPSQALEGIATLAILAVLSVLLLAGAFRRQDGKVFFLGIGLWAVGRAAVSTTWRDPTAIGQLPGGGVVAMAIASVCVLALIALMIRARMVPEGTDPDSSLSRVDDPTERAHVAVDPAGTDLAWPDPESRPRF